ncbi:1-phosphatidylinositol 4,5-bisphosphate phosphodiesterase-like isoform X1 [Thrips palmi]|uniref:1-phosphatidylinositol 4,5-bisphosphate phosphodiesterase n=1 Tax=Thrips palmi TaxID=161013 RepID=A0A6P8ZKZ1_THRPL|nr:1-phosphatidylinositol 4,5-bisphosphate phosphodiesterase-like isoform X1 [Thrips palmi]XP_034237945.1 1-phosphatidylinositol 4,5-bisphosphate phosphodiesterase-like isoform X1 [Thrips palmi]XP_034237946.1 1-phosphatidylinositol 4,5-bisphosphate phosphodiesterase-like isoform X1 [Thrips palmi]XP_034237947.1 1-phosphatidylinositol 4,5-bisphosphate phosphodiesterase-like isoform X1 [Thrips palmi]XP_034237949.1 1-phosphatidylinositol 4,5-bisphosphate phosphodiesterase-like isoform X1 [Thrips pa
MTKKLEFDWHIKVPNVLVNGCEFDMWTEEEGLESNCLFKVDEYGFFINWKKEGCDGDVLELCQVSDIRKGGISKDSKLYSQMQTNYGDSTFEDRVLTICSGRDYVNINYHHVVCPDSKTAEEWQNGLRKITHNNKMNNVCVSTNLMKHWMQLCMKTDPQGKVPVNRVVKTFASGKKDTKDIIKYLDDLELRNKTEKGKNDFIDSKDFTFEKFYTLYHKICPRTDDIGDLFSAIASEDEDYITVTEFIKFLNEKQRDPRLNEVLYPMYNEVRAMQIISTYEQDEKTKKSKKLSKDGFTRYLMSDENAPVFLDRLDVYMNMDQPLPHYYINSSHNTYLTGRQFYGKSSVEMYRQVLLAGCRCIELDCWDGDEEPIITHGKAMCTAIPFREVIHAIKDTAFETSEYPVILSLENHCRKAQQYILAKCCDDIFGDLLLKEPLKDYPIQPGAPLPSPNALKKKILIKNKRLDPEKEREEMEKFKTGKLNDDDGEKEDSAAPSPTVISLDKKRKILVASKRLDKGSGQEDIDLFLKGELVLVEGEKDNISVPSNSSIDKKVSDVLEGVPLPTHYTGSTTNVHPWLSSMVNYTQPVKFQGFDVAERNKLHYNMSSFNESNGLSYLKSQAIDFVQYNKRQMSRIYPRGTRLESTNFLPQVFWNAGCQMVALNFQTPDLAMQLNQGKFEYNGNCGYLLKPDFMRREDKVFDPFADTTVDGVIAAQCSVQVISGQFLSDKKVGTYVEVDMYGLPTDTIRKEFKTRLVPSNGLNPCYNESPFFFRKVVLPDLAVLRFGVFDETGKLLGQRILPLDGLQTGYRHIALRTEANFPMSLPMLFCNIQLKIYVPTGYEDIMYALSDPLKYQSDLDKRSKMIQQMGVDDDDDDKANRSGGSEEGSASGGTVKKGSKSGGKDEAATPSSSTREIGKLVSRNSSALVAGISLMDKSDVHEEPIKLATLEKEKSFIKLLKKNKKEVDSLQRKHSKELQAVQKAQCLAIEKLTKGKSFGTKEELSSDPQIHELVVEQIKQWSDIKEKHRSSSWELKKQHLVQQHDVLKSLLETALAAKIKQQEAHHEREIKQLNQKQAKILVETTREVNNDKTLKSKTEKDRCVREKKQTNIKKFMEEIKQLETILNKRKDDLKSKLLREKQSIMKEVEERADAHRREQIECQLTPKKEFFA